jgi:uncharacterized membrane protein
MKKLALHWQILLGMAAGVVFALLLSNFDWGPQFISNWIKPFGNIFINALKLIAVPLILQTCLIFFLAYGWARAWRVPHEVAAPGAMIGASNFFELAVAAAIALFGLQSGAALATVVGVLVEVPVMLALVRIANGTRHRFPIAGSRAAEAAP